MIMPHKLLRTALAGAAISCLCIAGAAAASLGVGTVDADGGLRLRADASTEGTVLATAPKGDHVLVLADAGDNWYKVEYQATEGYMSGEFLVLAQKADVAIGSGKVNTEGAALNLRSGPDTSFDKVATLPTDAVVEIVGVDNGWYKVTYNGATGYVSSDYMTTVKGSAGSRGSDETAPAASGVGAQVVEYAKQFIGTPYVYGGNGPSSFDCSGFTKYIYAHFGYTLNRTATDQLSNGSSVEKSQLQPGDLVFFKNNTSKPVSHVGIYIGGGQFIHASTNNYQVTIDNLNSGYYSRVYVYGRHIM